MIGCFCVLKEGSMRIHWLPPVVLLAASLPAAADSILIPLHHLSATEIERRLLPGDGHTPAPSGWVAQEERGMVPAGVTAWTVDERRNAFEVVGSDQGIQSFRQIIQLLDVPAPQVRLSVRVLLLVGGGLPGLTADPLLPAMPGRQPSEFAAAATRDQLAVLERQAALMSSEMTVTSNRPLHLLWGKGQDQPAVPATVMPRVNGDGTVSLYISRRGLSLVGQGGVIVLRRVAPGLGAAVISRTLGTALVVEVREVLPEPAAGN
jgi:hypothetical protein